MKKYILYILLIAILVMILLAAKQNTSPLSLEEITYITDNLYEQAAIYAPHKKLNKDPENSSPAIFTLVESGKPLDTEQSIQYRLLYQDILFNNQSLLRKFDDELTIKNDYAMDKVNNTGGFGIEGSHDHHDYSGRENLKKIKQSLELINTTPDKLISLKKIQHSNAIYKNATDILLHFATIPQTKSTPYFRPQNSENLPINNLFENMLVAFKSSQFEPVNSKAYIKHLHAALTLYDEFIYQIQMEIYKNTNIVERKLAGRWLSKQTLSPSVNDQIQMRFPRSSND